MRWPALPLLLLLAACASRPPAPPPPQSRIEVQQPRWKPVPARADGRAVPGGREHVVKPGETGLAIAQAYKVPWRTIAAANGIGYDSVIRVGQKLFVPTGAAPAAAPPQAASRPSGAQRSRAPGSQASRQPVAPATRDPEELARTFQMDIDELVAASAVAGSASPAPAPAARPPAPAPAAVPPLAWPVDGRVILSTFGPKPGGQVNEGVTIRAMRGGPVRAAAPGTILYVGDAIQSFGLLVLVRHEGGVVTAYGHLEEALVAKGQAVERGAIIGRAGTSGQAKEPQLLFQLRLGRKAVDPLPYLRRQA
ncbi:MAG: M23 family metallopeptidase [Sphingomonadaceae bacterium]